MRLSEVMAVMPDESKVMITVITPTGGTIKGQIMKVAEAVELYRMYLSDKVLNIESEYDWRKSQEIWDAVYTGILVSTLWRYRDE